MTAANKPPKYTAEETSEIIQRIATLRVRWLRAVETQLAYQRRAKELKPAAENHGRERVSAESRP
jgi:hypothetical protein